MKSPSGSDRQAPVEVTEPVCATRSSTVSAVRGVVVPSVMLLCAQNSLLCGSTAPLDHSGPGSRDPGEAAAGRCAGGASGAVEATV
ncbi:hypothetical protein STENM36S_05910 [Streptomyces tendae]